MATDYPSHVVKELTFPGPVQNGAGGMIAKRVQEWVTFHGFATPVDGDFGPATETCVRQFQTAKGLSSTGIVDAPTWTALVEPLDKALRMPDVSSGDTLADVILEVAKQHLAEHPIEIGGNNRGVWVRVYMGGNQGSQWLWCAGFVTFIMKQACMALERQVPIPGSYSCDSLAYQAKEAGLFVRGTDIENENVLWPDLGASQIFLVRHTSTDWTHTGFSFEGSGLTYSTVEGNTNDEGSGEGYEVCQRTRSVAKKDFIRLPA
jgi:Putative peptidoglycan binding domain